MSPSSCRQRDFATFLYARGGADDRTDHAIAWIAERQLGLIASWQLRAIGISHSAIARAVRRGALHRVYRGVFLVGHAVQVRRLGRLPRVRFSSERE
jgi:hypothetical protein